MSKTIDEKVVSMQFDNRNFESNVKTSLGTIERLKQSLNFSGQAKGLEEINTSVKRINVSPLSQGLEKVKNQFSALEVVGITALANITNSAVNTGKRMVSALTIDPIKTGFQEYETQIGSVQTILANTQHEGTNLQQVTKALDELNVYSDKTIYNFTEMTRNIGTFTAAGVKLQTSVDSIKGIANLAAISGSTSQQASTVMYQLSQALAAGKVSLMDWNSVVNAGMGGKVFQDALVRTSELLGTGAKKAIELEGSFRESLTKSGWLTTEVLTETLKQFAGAYTEADLIQQGFTKSQAKEIAEMAKTAEEAATKVKTFTQLWDTLKESAQSGWTKTWEILIGDFNESTDLLTEISKKIGDVISKTSEARNEFLSGGLSSGWKQLLNQGIVDEAGYIDSIKSIAKKSGKTFDKLVKETEKNGGTFTDALKKGLEEGIISSTTLSQAVYKLQENMSSMTEKELEAAGYTEDMVLQIEELSSKLKDGSVSMDEFTKKILRPSGRENIIQALWNSAEGLMSIIKPIKEAFKEIFPPATSEQLYEFTVYLKNLTSEFKISSETAGKLKNVFKGIFGSLKFGFDVISSVASSILQLIKSFSGFYKILLDVSSRIGNFISKFVETNAAANSFEKSMTGVSAAIEAISNSVFSLYKSGLSDIGPVFSKVGDVIVKISSKISDALSLVGESLINAFKTGDLTTFVNLLNGGIFSGILLSIKKFIKKLLDDIGVEKKNIFDSINDIASNITGVLDTVKTSLMAWQQNIKAGTLMKIAIAIGILTGSILILSTIDKEKLTSSLGAITTMFIELVVASASLNKLKGSLGDAISSVSMLIGLSLSILILSSALKKISGIDSESLTDSVLAIGGLASIMVASAKLISKGSGAVIKGASGLILFAFSIKILANVCEQLSELDIDEIGKGLLGVAGLMASASLFVNFTKSNGKMIQTSIMLIALATALLILQKSVKAFGDMTMDSIGRGLLAVGALLAEISGFSLLMGKSKKMISASIMLVVVAHSLGTMYSVLKDMSTLSWEDIGKGLVAIGGALLAITLSANKLPQDNLLIISGTLPALTESLRVLAKALLDLSTMSWEDVAKSLIATGVAMGILVGTLKVVGKLGTAPLVLLAFATTLVVLAGALSILGGLGIIGIATSLAGLFGVFVILGLASKIIGPMVPSLISLSGALVTLGASFIVFGVGLTFIGTGLLSIFTSFGTALLMLQGFDFGTIAKGLLLMASVFGVIALAGLLLKPFVGTILGVSGAIAVFALSCTAIAGAIALISAGLASLAMIGEEGAKTAVVVIKELALGITEMLPQLITNLSESFKALILGLVDIIVECAPPIADGLLKVVTEVLKSLVEYGPQIIDFVMQFIIDIINGIANRIPDLVGAIANLLGMFFSSVMSELMKIDPSTIQNVLFSVGYLTILMGAFAAVSFIIPAALKGVLGLGLVIGELSLVLAAIGGLAQIPGLTWIIGEGGKLLEAIGTAIGQFIGGLIGGIAQGITSSLPAMAEDLSLFMEKLAPFIDGASSISPKSMDGVKALAETILILTAADVLDGLTSWLTGGSSITEFAEQLAPFGEGIKKFGTAVKGINIDEISVAAQAVKYIAEAAASLPNSGGVVGWFAGENDLSQFTEQLVPFGKALKDYSIAVVGLNSDAVSTSVEATKKIVEVAESLPNSGGVVGWFAGENDLSQFADQIVPFGKALKKYSDAVIGVDPDAISISAKASKNLVETFDALPETGGVVGWWSGERDLSGFSDSIVPFGEALKDYSDAVVGIDNSSIYNSVRASKYLTDVLNNISSVDEKATEDYISNFGKGSDELVKNISSFTKAACEITTEQVSGSRRLFSIIKDIASSFGDSFPDIGSIESLGNVLPTFGSNIYSFVDTISSIDNMSSVEDVISQLVSLLSDLKPFIDLDLTSLSDKLKNFAETGVRQFANAFSSSDSKTMVRNAVKAMLKAASDAVYDTTSYNKFRQAGINVVNGFAIGISSNRQVAVDAASRLGYSTIKGLENSIQSHSPSKASYKRGEYFGQGYINAIKDEAKRSYYAGYNMGDESKKGLSNAIRKIQQIMSNDIDYQPTIQPVLDLSEIQNGASYINGMLAFNPRIGVLSDLNDINLAMNSNNRFDNSDVISAIKNLGKDIGKIQTNQYNIGGVSYSDNKEVSDAISVLVRAAKIGGRS